MSRLDERLPILWPRLNRNRAATRSGLSRLPGSAMCSPTGFGFGSGWQQWRRAAVGCSFWLGSEQLYSVSWVTRTPDPREAAGTVKTVSGFGLRSQNHTAEVASSVVEDVPQ